MTDPVWSVNIILALGMLGTAWVIYYILILDTKENVSVQNQEDTQDRIRRIFREDREIQG